MSFRLGLVEGFFGRQWTWEARRDYAPFLSAQGCNSYVYAPKNDAWLRKQWQAPFPQPHLDALSALSQQYRAHGVDFGVGLSPYELYKDFSPRNRELLLAKVAQINAIGADTLCILFDDMMGDLRDLAQTQLEIMDAVTQHSSARRFAICPTYYSDDPLLVRHFGTQPEHYLEDLGTGLDTSIEIFWTGPKVISTDYPRPHLREVADKLRRKPLLWDNYPVNDAKRLTSFLHLKPANRSPELKELTSGHLANPMNQPYLSQLPLHALAALYAGRSASFEAACDALCPRALSQALQQDVELFQTQGLDVLDAASKEQLLRKYGNIKHAMAEEVCAWLRGEYAFDPACLT
jgi:hyaluronoglucosaminidase